MGDFIPQTPSSLRAYRSFLSENSIMFSKFIPECVFCCSSLQGIESINFHFKKFLINAKKIYIQTSNHIETDIYLSTGLQTLESKSLIIHLSFYIFCNCCSTQSKEYAQGGIILTNTLNIRNHSV